MTQQRPRWSGPLDCSRERGFVGSLKLEAPAREDHLEGAARWAAVTVDVASDGDRLVSHAGAALLAEAADRLGLTDAVSRALAGMRERRGRHNPGRVVRELAVMLADGGDCLSDLRAVRDQRVLFGPVASDATAFRVIDRIASDPVLLGVLRAARARARAIAWDARAAPDRIVVDIDATPITAHAPSATSTTTVSGSSSR